MKNFLFVLATLLFVFVGLPSIAHAITCEEAKVKYNAGMLSKEKMEAICNPTAAKKDTPTAEAKTAPKPHQRGGAKLTKVTTPAGTPLTAESVQEMINKTMEKNSTLNVIFDKNPVGITTYVNSLALLVLIVLIGLRENKRDLKHRLLTAENEQLQQQLLEQKERIDELKTVLEHLSALLTGQPPDPPA